MSIGVGHALFFVLASVVLALLALPALSREGRPGVAEGFGWLAMAAGLCHPLAVVVADGYGLAGDLTPFLAGDLVAVAALAGAAANRAPGGRGFAPLLLVAASALVAGTQALPATGPGISGALLASVLLCVALIGAGAECARHARLFRESTRALAVLALACGAAALLWLVAALLLAGAAAPAASTVPLLEGAGMLWLLLKLAMSAALLQLFAARRGERDERLQRALVSAANEAVQDLRVLAQAFYQMPARALVAGRDGQLLFATAEARRQLGYPDLSGRTLEDLFVAVQPAGNQRVRALFERQDRQAQLLQIRMGTVECGGQSCHLLLLEPQAFDFSGVRDLLVDSRHDDAHEATGLLDHHFALVAMADGWFRLMEPLDRYAGSGLFWDKLRILSAGDSEISHLESTAASAPEADGWLRMRNGGGLSVSLRRLLTPEQKTFYRVRLVLVDEARHAVAGAPCADDGGRA